MLSEAKHLGSPAHSVPMRLCHFRLVIGAWSLVIAPIPLPQLSITPPLHSLLSAQHRSPFLRCAPQRTAAMGDRVLRRSVHLGEGNRMPVGDEKRIVSKAL